MNSDCDYISQIWLSKADLVDDSKFLFFVQPTKSPS